MTAADKVRELSAHWRVTLSAAWLGSTITPLRPWLNDRRPWTKIPLDGGVHAAAVGTMTVRNRSFVHYLSCCTTTRACPS